VEGGCGVDSIDLNSPDKHRINASTIIEAFLMQFCMKTLIFGLEKVSNAPMRTGGEHPEV
jgi:hypothetical protein